MTVKKSVLAQRLAELMGEGTDPAELEKYTVQKLHYEIQKLEEKPEPEPEPEVEAPPKEKEKKEKSLWRLISLDDDSSSDEE